MLNPIAHIQRVLKRRSHYRAVFNGTPSAEAVLADLKRFCRYGESPLIVSPSLQQVDPVATGVQIGRQEVMQRILTHLHIDDAHLLNLKEQNDE